MSSEFVLPRAFSDVTKVRVDRGLDTPAYLQARLIESCANNTVAILQSNLGQPIGYIAWARVSRETLNMIVKTNQMPTYVYEYFDGKLMLIYDVVFNREWSSYAWDEFYNFISKKRLFAYYKKGKIIVCAKKSWKMKRINPKTINFIK